LNALVGGCGEHWAGAQLVYCVSGEEALSQRLEQHCLQNGFTVARYMQSDSLLSYPINEYLEHHFFNALSNHLNLFMYLPKTPFYLASEQWSAPRF